MDTKSPQVIPIDNIDVEMLRLRNKVDKTVAEEYARNLNQGEELPPIAVFKSDGRYILLDGRHRIEANRLAGRHQVNAEIRSGTWSDAVRFALSANATHGLRRTNADKRACIRTAIREFPSISDREIARICGVDHKTTGRVRQELTGDFPQLNPEKKTGRDGKMRRMPRGHCNGDSRVSNDETKKLETKKSTDSEIIGTMKMESEGSHSENGKTDNSLQILGDQPARNSASGPVDEILQKIEALDGSGFDYLDGLRKIADACTAKIEQILNRQERSECSKSSKTDERARAKVAGIKRTVSMRKRSKKKVRRT